MKDLSQIIHDDFYRRLGADRQVQRIIRSGGDLVEVSKLAGMIGQHLVRAMQSNLVGAELPFGTEEMTQIAREILDPMLRDNCKLLDRVFDEVQQRLDEAQGTALGTVHTGFPAVRAEQIYASAADPAAPPETILRRLSIPPETLINSHLDRTMQANARLRSSAGFETFIERTDDGKCCEWCSKMAGRYEYPDKTPKDVFRRHDNCGCRVVWVSGNMRQDVHSKATWEQPDVTVPELTKNPDVKVPELTRGLLTEGKKSSIMGLGAGTGNTYVQEHKKPDFLKNINFDDDKAVQSVLSEFEKLAADSDIEMACVIAKNGSVFYCYGIKDAVYPDSDLGDLIKGAVISHNHVKSETSFSFGGDDLATFQNNDLKMLIGFDYKYRYILDKNASLIDDIPDDWQTFENFQHTSNIYTAQMRGYGYRRVRI